MSGPNIGQAQPGLLEATSAADRECMVNTLSMLEQARKGPLPWLETFDALKCAGVQVFLQQGALHLDHVVQSQGVVGRKGEVVD